MGRLPAANGGAAVALALALATAAGCGARNGGNGPSAAETVSGARTASPPEDFFNQRPGVAYIGDEACARCHASIARTYHASRMAKSWRDAAPGAWPEATTPATVDDPA